jgi:hypothetical protein
VGSAPQPCLIVRDMKRGDRQGAVALWIGPGTEGYFRNLTIIPAGTEKSPKWLASQPTVCARSVCPL